MRRSAALLILGCLTALVSAGAVEPPATHPAAGADAARVSLAGGAVTFVPPANWQQAAKSSNETTAAYVTENHQGAVAIQVLPPEAHINATTGGAIVKKLRDNHKQAGQKVVMDPTVERDPHYLLRIHEKYEAGDKIADQFHLYRQVGPRVVMVTVSSLAKADEQTQEARAIHQTGEDLAASAQFVRPTKKAPQ